MKTIQDILDKCSFNEAGCLIWSGGKTADGYGGVFLEDEKKHKVVHRVVYEHFIGPIPDGLVIDHKCRNRACCNTDHLEVVTNKENILRGESPSAKNAKKEKCFRGHQFTKKQKKGRQCWVCKLEKQRERRAKARNNRTQHEQSLN